MAITRDDYRYIHNTLLTSSETKDGELKIGSYINNLLPELDPQLLNTEENWKTVDESIITGALSITVQLEPKTCYVLQILDNSIADSNSNNIVEKRLFAETVSFPASKEENILFVANNEQYSSIKYVYNNRSNSTPHYQIYFTTDDNEKEVYNNDNSPAWIDNAYQTVFARQAITLNSTPFSYNYTEKMPLLENGLDKTYYYFQTSDQTPETTLIIPGLTPGLKTTYKSWEAAIEPKVFLFKTNSSWIVNREGQIVGLMSIPLERKGAENNTESIGLSYSKEEMIEIFQEAPQLTISKNAAGIQVNLPSALQKEYRDVDNFLDHLYLIAYRDNLVDQEPAVWVGADKVKKKTKSRYGQLNYINNTKHAANDPARQNSELIQYKQRNVEGNIEREFFFNIQIDSKGIPWKDGLILKVEDKTYIQKTKKERFAFNLGLGSALGYNYKYNQDNPENSKYKFTSVAFKWAYYDQNERIILSNYSIPVVIDRTIAKNFTIENNNWVFSAPEVSYIRKPLRLGPEKAIYVIKKEPN